MKMPTRDLIRCAAARQAGQGLVEYGMILTGVFLAVVVTVLALGPRISALYDTVRGSIPTP